MTHITEQTENQKVQTETTNELTYTFKTDTSAFKTSSGFAAVTNCLPVSSSAVTEIFTEIEENNADHTIPLNTAVQDDQSSKKLNDFLLLSGFQADNSKQIITVQSSCSACHVCFFDNTDDIWNIICEADGIVGKNGVSDKSMEGDYRTPKGKFSLGFAFGTENLDGLSVEYRKINENCYWIDDPESPLYNTWIETDEITWKSAEHMADYPECYKYGVVINYNMDPVEKYKGSAIFLHCMKDTFTAGCVGVPEDMMLTVINTLDHSKNPVIIII